MNSYKNRSKPISVFIIQYKSLDYTVNAIKSILNQSLKPDSVFIFDIENNELISNSNHHTLKSLYDNLIYLNIKEGTGYAELCNMALNKSYKNKHICFICNSDIKLDKNCLFNLQNVLNKEKSAAVVGPLVLSMDNISIVQSAGLSINEYTGLLKSFYYNKNEKEVLKYNYFKVPAVSGCAMLIDPLRIPKETKFNHKMYMYFEDIEFSQSVQDIGKEVYVVPLAKAWHKGSVSFKNNSSLQIELAIKNHLYMTDRLHLSFKTIKKIIIGLSYLSLIAIKRKNKLLDLAGFFKGLKKYYLLDENDEVS